jgi:GTP-binding protein
LNELKRFDPKLAKRPTIVAMSKADITEVREEYKKVKARFKRKKIELRLFSSATGEGVKEVLRELFTLVAEAKKADTPRSVVGPKGRARAEK